MEDDHVYLQCSILLHQGGRNGNNTALDGGTLCIQQITGIEVVLKYGSVPRGTTGFL